MVSRSVIGFDDDPREDDEVTFAVAPIDVNSGRIIPRNIIASITVADESGRADELHLPDKPIRNLSGLLVFINLPAHSNYRVQVEARDAGYFNPDPVVFTPPERKDKLALELKDLLRIDFILYPRPDFTFSKEATLISGVVVTGKKSEEGAQISVLVPSDIGMGNPRPPSNFETRTDQRGAFTLALRLPAFSENEDNGNRVDISNKGVLVEIKIATRGDDDVWLLKKHLVKQEVIEGRRRVFKKPIDLNDPEDPGLLTI